MEELDRYNVDEYKKLVKAPVTVVLDNIRSANNVGSFFRTADAFRIQKIYLCGITSAPPNKEIHKTALGATESVDWEYAENSSEIINKLNKEGTTTIAIEQAENSMMLNNFQLKHDVRGIALVFGNEVNGIGNETIELCSYCVEIPQWGTKHSLNVAVTGGIVLWEFLKHLKLPYANI